MPDLRSEIPVSQVEIHGHTRPKRLEIHMSYVCDQKCPFCSESRRMAAFERDPVSYRNIVKTLIRKRREGCDHVTFTGGEPTLHPRFIDILRSAKSLGYRTYATSDGQRLASSEYAEQTLPFLDELCLSIHGSSAEIHDPAVQKPGSFEQLMAAVEHIRDAARPPYLLTNTVLTKETINSIEATIALLSGLGPVRHCTISNLAPDGDALKNYDRLAVRLEEIRAIAPIVAKICRERGVSLRFFGVPLCVLDGNWDLPNDLHWTPRVTVERGMVEGQVGLREIVSPNPGRMRFFAPKCGDCGLQGKCWGIFRVYYNRFGDGEVRPM